MLPLEHSAILSTFIKLPFVIKIFVLSIFEWQFYTDFTVSALISSISSNAIALIIKIHDMWMKISINPDTLFSKIGMRFRKKKTAQSELIRANTLVFQVSIF